MLIFTNLPQSIDSNNVIYALDIIGVCACSVAATLLAKQKGLDIFGCILIAMVNAIGGGTLRDVLLDRHPLFWMTDLTYFMVIVGFSIGTQIFFHLDKHIDKWLTAFDAIGLAAFSIIGLKVALSFHVHPIVAVMMGIMTAIVGGLLRDIVCNEIPLVLRREIYITASLIGSIIYLALTHTQLPAWLIDFSVLSITFSIRMLAVYFDWHLPSISLKDY